MAAIQFATTCPKRQCILEQTYDLDILAGFLNFGVVTAYCIFCDHHWDIQDGDELQKIKEAYGARLLKELP